MASKKPNLKRKIEQVPFRRGDAHWHGLDTTPSKDRGIVYVAVENTWVEVPLKDKRPGRTEEWVVAYRLVEQGGYPVVAELRLFPAEELFWKEAALERDPGQWSAEFLGQNAKVPTGGITARMVREVKIGEHHRLANEFIRSLKEEHGGLLDLPAELEPFQRKLPGPTAVISSFEIKKPKNTRRKPHRQLGKGRRPDIIYAELAQQYVRLLEVGSKRPIVELAKQLGIDRSRVRDMIHAARKRGLLDGGQQGKRGGYLTDKALRVLRPTRREKE